MRARTGDTRPRNSGQGCCTGWYHSCGHVSVWVQPGVQVPDLHPRACLRPSSLTGSRGWRMTRPCLDIRRSQGLHPWPRVQPVLQPRRRHGAGGVWVGGLTLSRDKPSLQSTPMVFTKNVESLGFYSMRLEALFLCKEDGENGTDDRPGRG